MAKSLRSKSQKRNRAAMRSTIGARDETKVLRKVVRRSAARAITVGAVANEAAARSLLGGVGGSSAHMVTLAPTHRRKLPFTFNAALREQRLRDGLEDDTDDEAVEAGALNQNGELARGEPAPTGVASLAAAAARGSGGGGGGGGDDDGMAEGEGAEAEALRRLLGVEQSGRKRAGDKPTGKREMSASFYDWQTKDLINPAVPGFFYEELPKGKGRAERDAKGGAGKGAGRYKHLAKKR